MGVIVERTSWPRKTERKMLNVSHFYFFFYKHKGDRVAIAGFYHCTACSLSIRTLPSHESRQIRKPHNWDSQPRNNSPQASVRGSSLFYVLLSFNKNSCKW